jgi:hypothetical protein
MVAATVVGASAAHADRKMLVLIDASGSMSTVRGDSKTRFEAAKLRAVDQIGIQDALGATTFAVYTFSTTTPPTRQTPVSAAHPDGFVDKTTAINVIAGNAGLGIPPLDLFTVGGGSTPLAGSMCDVVDTLVATGATTKILEVASDGEENSTPIGHQCQGAPSTDPNFPYSDGSWQNLVVTKLGQPGNTVQVQIDLFDPGPITMARVLAAAADPEAQLTAQQRALSAGAMLAAPGDGPPTLKDFFAQVALITGGRLTVIEDPGTTVPVIGDADGNSCIDRRDAIALARSFGETGAPQDLPFDLDFSGSVGFTDYAAEVSRFTPGGCGVPDPYTPRAPIVCRGALMITMNAQVIENGGITIDARGSCVITIKNSLIVSGANALDIRGSALITVQNSILVGQNAVLSSGGSTMLMAKDSVFHGQRLVNGAFTLVDLGGNTFE